MKAMLKKEIVLPAVISLVIGIATFLSVKLTETENAYVINADVYNSFELKKELEARMTATQQQRKNILDSLALRLEMRAQTYRLNGASDTLEANAIRSLQQDFYMRQQQFEEDNTRMVAEYEEQIWKQLNQYAQDYGKENGYSIVFGANGDGGIMYGDQAVNVTEELKEYANEKFNGGK